MSKYIDADQIRAEIKRLKREAIGRQPMEGLEEEVERFCENMWNSLPNFNYSDGKAIITVVEKAARHFYELGLNARKEQPAEGLEAEINACWQNWLSPSNQKEVEGVLPKTEFAMYARHFAEWGAEHLKR